MTDNCQVKTKNSSQSSIRDRQEVLIRCEHVSKKFCRSLKKSLWYGMQDIASELNPFSRKQTTRVLPADSKLTAEKYRTVQDASSLRQDEFWAVRDVSFELRRGECLALIGRNGAGKTTLLKMLNGLIKPDSGRIEMRGRVGALIALGAGFNPILSGRENIYVNGSILGLSKHEIDQKLEDIIAFAEVDQFIDSPVQSYSSGMQVRLGFAVATALHPDVLILDEVLAVGDAAFRAKCYNRIVSLRKQAAVIFVTHSMEQVSRICDLGLLMSKGKVLFHGDVGQSIKEYDKINEVGMEQDESFLSLQSPLKNFEIIDLPTVVKNGDSFDIQIKLDSQSEFDDFKIRISFYNPSGAIVAEINQSSIEHEVRLMPGENTLNLVVPGIPLRAARYLIGCNVIDRHGALIAWSYKQYELNVTGMGTGTNSDCQIPISVWTIA